MGKEKVLFKNTIIYSIGNFGSKMLSFILLPLYTHYLSTNDYGYFDLITTTVTLLVPIITFQVFDGLYRYLLDSNNFNDYSTTISNSFFIISRNLIIFILGYIIVIQFVSVSYPYIILFQIISGILSSFWLQVSRGLRRSFEYSISGILSTLLILASNVVFIVFMRLGVGSLILSSALGSLVTIMYLERKLRVSKFIKIELNDSVMRKRLISYSIPLIPNLISWWFMNLSDRYFLTFYKGMETNGVYAIANKFPSILIVLNSIFSLAWQESAITEYHSQDRNKFYTNMFNMLVNIEFTSVIILISFTRVLMVFLVDDKFSAAWLYVPLLYMSTIFNSFSSFYGAGYLSSKDTIGAFYTSVVGGVINVFLNIILIPNIGIQGAALSTMMSFLIMWGLRVFQTKKYFTIHIDYKKLLALTVMSIVFILLYYINNIIINILMMIASIIIFFGFNKRLILKFVNIGCSKLGITRRNN